MGKHYDISCPKARDPVIIWVWSLHPLRFTEALLETFLLDSSFLLQCNYEDANTYN